MEATNTGKTRHLAKYQSIDEHSVAQELGSGRERTERNLSYVSHEERSRISNEDKRIALSDRTLFVLELELESSHHTEVKMMRILAV